MSNFKGKTLINVDIAKRIVGKEKGFFLLVPPITLSPLLPRLEGNSRKLPFFATPLPSQSDYTECFTCYRIIKYYQTPDTFKSCFGADMS